jgi:hypothetical protein
MGGSRRQSSLGGHAGRSAVGGSGSLCAFYKPEGGQERGREGMRLTTMVDLERGGEGRRRGLHFERGGVRVRLGGEKASRRRDGMA